MSLATSPSSTSSSRAGRWWTNECILFCDTPQGKLSFIGFFYLRNPDVSSSLRATSTWSQMSSSTTRHVTPFILSLLNKV